MLDHNIFEWVYKFDFLYFNKRRGDSTKIIHIFLSSKYYEKKAAILSIFIIDMKPNLI